MLYIIGGRNNSLSGNVDCDSVDRYDPLLDEWKSVCSLTVPRNRVGIGVIDGYVYAIGGSHGNLYLNLVEKYDADEDRWVEVAPLTVPRIGKFSFDNLQQWPLCETQAAQAYDLSGTTDITIVNVLDMS